MLLCYFFIFSKFVYLLRNIFSAKNFTDPPYIGKQVDYFYFFINIFRVAEKSPAFIV